MRKWIEIIVKVIVLGVLLLASQEVIGYLENNFAQTFKYTWVTMTLFYAIRVLTYMIAGGILAYNERKSSKAAIYRTLLFGIGLFLVAIPFLFNQPFYLSNGDFFRELIRILALAFGILLTGMKL
jgi:sulfite exporter TauE/SafE